MIENQREITVIVNRPDRNIYFYLIERDKAIYEESEFRTRTTKSGKAYFQFIQGEGASLFTPSAWINIEM